MQLPPERFSTRKASARKRAPLPCKDSGENAAVYFHSCQKGSHKFQLHMLFMSVYGVKWQMQLSYRFVRVVLEHMSGLHNFPQEHYKETQRLASVIEDEMVPLYVHNAMQETHHRELDIYYETLNERLRAQERSHQANLHSLTHPCSTQRVVAAGMQIYSAYGTWDDWAAIFHQDSFYFNSSHTFTGVNCVLRNVVLTFWVRHFSLCLADIFSLGPMPVSQRGRRAFGTHGRRACATWSVALKRLRFGLLKLHFVKRFSGCE